MDTRKTENLDRDSVTEADQVKALRALALTEDFSISDKGEFQFGGLKVTNITIDKKNNNVEIETDQEPVNKNLDINGKKISSSQTSSYTPLEFKQRNSGRTYLKFANKEEELEWMENNEFINRIAPFLYILASTLAFLWAQAFYWWKRLPNEEQICVRDMFGGWFCERGKTAQLTLKNHPNMSIQSLGNRDTLISYQLAGHTGLSIFLAYATTIVAKCFKRSDRAGDELNEERVILLYYVSRFIVVCGIICQWGHMALMQAKFQGILMADWAMDFRATLPYIASVVVAIISVFAYTLYDIDSLSKKYDTGVAMVLSEEKKEDNKNSAKSDIARE